MTATPIAGRELDAEIAVHVMGWKRPEDARFGIDMLEPPDDDTVLRKIPFYSTDIAAALSDAEHLRKTKGLGYVIGTNGMALQQNGVKFFDGFHSAGHSIFDAEEHPGEYAVDDTIPLALCKAALRAVAPAAAAQPKTGNE